MLPKVRGKLLVRLNTTPRPIANKYREGKVKRTLKRELKVPEIAGREANRTSFLGELVVCYGDGLLRQRKRRLGF